MSAQIVSFRCVMKNKLGQVLGSSFNHDVINQLDSSSGTHDLEGLIAGLQNVKEGEKRQIAVPAGLAYGLYNPELLIELRTSELNPGVHFEIGGTVVKQMGPRGESVVFRVVKSHNDFVVLDGNHPLAGQDLIFDIDVISAREAVEADFEIPKCTSPKRQIH